MTPEALLERVVAVVPAARALPLAEMRGQAVVWLPRQGLAEALTTLRDNADTRFEQLSDLTAVDYLGRTPRFEVVYQLHSLAHRRPEGIARGAREIVARNRTGHRRSRRYQRHCASSKGPAGLTPLN